MATEIERKWVAAAVPAAELAADGVRTKRLRQGYVAVDGDVAVRIRVVDETAAVLTVKAGSGLMRTEVEVPLDLVDADALWARSAGRRIEKVRHDVPLPGGLTAEVDVYGDELDGLCTVEVEFADADAAAAFVPPAWFGRDVTGDPAWTNAALARHGRPDR